MPAQERLHKYLRCIPAPTEFNGSIFYIQEIQCVNPMGQRSLLAPLLYSFNKVIMYKSATPMKLNRITEVEYKKNQNPSFSTSLTIEKYVLLLNGKDFETIKK